jgi:hypothetical protein
MENEIDHGDLVNGDRERDLGTHGRSRYAGPPADRKAQGHIVVRLSEEPTRIDAVTERKPHSYRERMA